MALLDGRVLQHASVGRRLCTLARIGRRWRRLRHGRSAGARAEAAGGGEAADGRRGAVAARSRPKPPRGGPAASASPARRARAASRHCPAPSARRTARAPTSEALQQEEQRGRRQESGIEIRQHHHAPGLGGDPRHAVEQRAAGRIAQRWPPPSASAAATKMMRAIMVIVTFGSPGWRVSGSAHPRPLRFRGGRISFSSVSSRSASRGRLVPADAGNAGKAHGDPGFVPRRAVQALEGDLQHQPLAGSCVTSRTGPKRLMVLRRTNRSSSISSSSVKPK